MGNRFHCIHDASVPGQKLRIVKLYEFIRHAAQTRRGLGWCVYDHKFRCKAALNLSLDWSLIGQQLWLMIFTTSPDILLQRYPNFSNGSHNWSYSEGVLEGLCRNFNRAVMRSHQPCRYQLRCNHPGNHLGSACTSLNSRSGKQGQRKPKREHTSSKPKRC